MTKRLLALSRVPAALLFAVLSSCATSRGGSAPPAAEAPEEDLSAAKAADADGVREESAAEEQEAEPAPGSEAALIEEQDEQEAPEGETAEPEGTIVSLKEQLEQRIVRFEGSLGTVELSCSGAAPHRDAICSIAERICEMEEGPTTAPSKECSRAQESCKKAKERFAEKCQ